MKRIISLICIFVLLLSLGAVGASAIPKPIWSGDVDFDDRVTVRDATSVQKSIAHALEFTALQERVADADGDGVVTVRDVTAIQIDIAKIDPIDYFVLPYVNYEAFYADYVSGRAMAGTPVTFTVLGEAWDSKAEPFAYEFYVDGELVRERDGNNTFAYTFESAGTYDIEAVIYNRYDFSTVATLWGYEVTEPYNTATPVIRDFYYTDDRHTQDCVYLYEDHEDGNAFVAEAAFGAGDYEYAFLLDGEVIRDYSADNTYTFERFPEVKEDTAYTLTVRVKDSSTGDSFVSADIYFYVELAQMFEEKVPG